MIPPSRTVSNAGASTWTTLLLDPDPAAAVLASQLRHAGFEPSIATNGYAALLAIRTTRFGAIVVVADLTNIAIRNDLRALRQGLPVHLMSKVPFSALRCSIQERHA
jgi:DNA-binding response OmpR family regulator